MQKTVQYKGFTLKYTSVHGAATVYQYNGYGLKPVHSARTYDAAKAWCDTHAY